MKKFFAAIVMVCLIGAFSNQAMAQGAHRDNGRPGPAPAAAHQPAPAHHVNAVPAPRPAAQPAPRHAKPAPPPPAPRHAKPLPPPPPAPHHARPVPPPPPRPAVGYRPDNGLYIGIGPIGIRIPL